MSRKKKNIVEPYDNHKHIALEGGGVATVSKDCPPDLIKALNTLSHMISIGKIKLKNK